MLIKWKDIYFIITQKFVHKGKDLTPRIIVDDLIYKGGGIVVLRESLIVISIVNIDSNCALLLIHRDNNLKPTLSEGSDI